MLVKLLKTDIDRLWNIIAPMIEKSLPDWVDLSENVMTNILESLMVGNLTGWFIYTDSKKPEIVGFGTTRIAIDEMSGERTLIIYSLYSLNKITKGIWMNATEKITRYAITQKCTSIAAFSNLENVVKLSEMLGADTSVTYIQWRLTNG